MPLIQPYFDFVRAAIAEQLASLDPLFVAHTARSQSVIFVRQLSSGPMPFRFICLTGMHQREEFGLDIGWSDERKLPNDDYFGILLERGLSIDSREIPHAPCCVPLISRVVLGSAEDLFDVPAFEATPPSLARLAQAARDSFASDASMKRLRSLCASAGLAHEIEEARSPAGARRMAPKLFGVFDSPLPEHWGMIQFLAGLRPSDCDAALSGPCAVAGALLAEYAVPLLQSDNLTPVA